MGIDIPKPYVSRMETTERSWPKCKPCSDKLGKLYPVESCAIVSTERPNSLRSRWRIVVEVRCHDLVQRMVVDSANWHGTANDWDAIGDHFAFVQKRGSDGRVRYATERIDPSWRHRKRVALFKGA